MKTTSKKRRVKVTSKTTKPKPPPPLKKTNTGSAGGEPDLLPLTAQVNTFTQAHNVAQDQGLSLGSVLDTVNQLADTMRPSPSTFIPRLGTSTSGDSEYNEYGE